LLNASDINLDDLTDSIHTKPNRDRFRDEGIVLRVQVHLDNKPNFYWNFNNINQIPNPNFYYKVTRVPHMEFKVNVPSENQSRTYNRKHNGIFISFYITGSLASFSWFNLLACLLSYLAIIKLLLGMMESILDNFIKICGKLGYVLFIVTNLLLYWQIHKNAIKFQK